MKWQVYIMELEIGMYVRTINGKIWVITSQRAISGHRKDIINASYNIIDLIEVGDYVNGEKIIETSIDRCGRKFLIYGYDNGDRQVAITIYKEDIKSIVTKEQFKNMEYEVK